MTHTTTFEQLGQLLALQAEIGRASTLPGTQEEAREMLADLAIEARVKRELEAQERLEAQESLKRGRAELMRRCYEPTGWARRLTTKDVT